MTTNDHPLSTVTQHFRAMAATIGADQWELSTPCPDWNVTELVGHVVAGSQMAAAIAAGADRGEAIDLLSTDFLRDDPQPAIATALALAETALIHPDVDDRICQHPAGNMPGSQVRSFRISDLLVHQWDLARAIGADEALDADVVQLVWDDISPMAPIIAQLGPFGDGPSGTVPEDAPLQQRLLDLMGRRP